MHDGVVRSGLPRASVPSGCRPAVPPHGTVRLMRDGPAATAQYSSAVQQHACSPPRPKPCPSAARIVLLLPPVTM